MFCVIALIIFAIMGIFSASHRQLAAEAFKCVFKKVTFRPCDTGFRDKMKGKMVGALLRRSTFAAKVFNNHFELLSWLFFILMVGSTVWVIRGGYNFYYYGSCNGLNDSGFCAFDPSGGNNKVSSLDDATCSAVKPSEANLTLKDVDLSLFQIKQASTTNTLVFIGCYSCDYTRKAYPIIQDLLKKKPINYIFAHFPVKSYAEYLTGVGVCAYSEDKNKFWRLNDALFASTKEQIADPLFVDGLLSDIGYDPSKIKTCTESAATKATVETMRSEIKKTGIYGTPLIFINGTPLVGPKPARVYENMLR